MEIDPGEQKTLPDFTLTEKMLGIKAVCITALKKDGNRLHYERDGRRIPVRRIYNRAIVDELQRKNVKLNFDFRDDLDVEWAGHPNWYFRISKYSIPYLKHESVPKTWFLDKLESIPDDLENYALKPLYSFAGLGVIISPKESDIRAIPNDRRHAKARFAWRQLMTRRSSLTEIALEAGFSDQSHMTRAVRAITGRTPGAWRLHIK